MARTAGKGRLLVLATPCSEPGKAWGPSHGTLTDSRLRRTCTLTQYMNCENTLKERRGELTVMSPTRCFCCTLTPPGGQIVSSICEETLLLPSGTHQPRHCFAHGIISVSNHFTMQIG